MLEAARANDRTRFLTASWSSKINIDFGLWTFLPTPATLIAPIFYPIPTLSLPAVALDSFHRPPTAKPVLFSLFLPSISSISRPLKKFSPPPRLVFRAFFDEFESGFHRCRPVHGPGTLAVLTPPRPLRCQHRADHRSGLAATRGVRTPLPTAPKSRRRHGLPSAESR